MSVEKLIRHYQRSVEKSTDDADRILHCVTKLYHLPITVQHLQDTGVGRTINGLRKYDGQCGEAAKACVAKWKAMVAAEESSDPETENVEASSSYDETSKVENSHVYTPLQGTSSSRHHRQDKDEVKTNGVHRKHHSEYDSKTKDDSNKSKKPVEEIHSLKHKERTAHSAKAAKETHPTSSGSASSRTHHQKSSKDIKISSKSSSSSKSEDVDSSKCSRSKVSTSEESSDGRDVVRKPKSGGSHLEKSQSREKKINIDSLSESPKPRSSHKRVEKTQSREKKVKVDSLDDGIDCLSGASFAEALGMVSPVKRRSSPSPHKPGTSRKNTSPKKSKLVDTGSAKEFDFLSLSSPSNLSPLPLALELPAIDPNYRPLPELVYDEARRRKAKPLTEEEALSKVMYHRAERTRVFSGVKGSAYRRGEPPTLFDACLRVLGDNLDYLGYTGGVPFAILEPVLKRATPDQLFELERHNPYLLEDTDALWEFHCNKQFRNMKLEEMESYREMFLRGLDERAAKLEALTSNIKLSQAASVPVRQAKLTYMDTVAKPPREVARQQARHGTARLQVGPSRVRPVSPVASAASSRVKKRVAPLMQKTMKFAKTFKR